MNNRNVHNYVQGFGSISFLKEILNERKLKYQGVVIYSIDIYFQKNGLPKKLNFIDPNDLVIYIDSSSEPTTKYVNDIKNSIIKKLTKKPSTIVGLGGGSTLDISKAVSNLITNKGNAEKYQGWDLVKKNQFLKLVYLQFQEQVQSLQKLVS